MANASKTSNGNRHIRTHVRQFVSVRECVCVCFACGSVAHVNIFIGDLVRTRNHCIRKMCICQKIEKRFDMKVSPHTVEKICVPNEYSFTHLNMGLHIESARSSL